MLFESDNVESELGGIADCVCAWCSLEVWRWRWGWWCGGCCWCWPCAPWLNGNCKFRVDVDLLLWELAEGFLWRLGLKNLFNSAMECELFGDVVLVAMLSCNPTPWCPLLMLWWFCGVNVVCKESDDLSLFRESLLCLLLMKLKNDLEFLVRPPLPLWFSWALASTPLELWSWWWKGFLGNRLGILMNYSATDLLSTHRSFLWYNTNVCESNMVHSYSKMKAICKTLLLKVSNMLDYPDSSNSDDPQNFNSVRMNRAQFKLKIEKIKPTLEVETNSKKLISCRRSLRGN